MVIPPDFDSSSSVDSYSIVPARHRTLQWCAQALSSIDPDSVVPKELAATQPVTSLQAAALQHKQTLLKKLFAWHPFVYCMQARSRTSCPIKDAGNRHDRRSHSHCGINK